MLTLKQIKTRLIYFKSFLSVGSLIRIGAGIVLLPSLKSSFIKIKPKLFAVGKSQAMGDKNKSRGRKRKQKRQMKEGQFRPRPVSQPDVFPDHTEGSASKRNYRRLYQI